MMKSSGWEGFSARLNPLKRKERAPEVRGCLGVWVFGGGLASLQSSWSRYNLGRNLVSGAAANQSFAALRAPQLRYDRTT